jgi:protein involved in polysaccharide export with SLBB domain
MSKPIRSFVALLVALAAAACSSAPPFDAQAVAREWASFMQRDYVLRAGDRLMVRVDGLSQGVSASATDARDNIQEVIVSPTGTIDLRRLAGPLMVAGKSVGAVRTLVLESYRAIIPDGLGVSVTLTEAATQSVYVFGEVFRPGPVPFSPGLSMTQAIAAGGGFNYTVKHSDIRILRIAPDGTQRTFRVNMSDVLLDESPDFLLLPGDVVYCQTSTVADIGNLVDLYFRRMLPFQIGGPAIGTIE